MAGLNAMTPEASSVAGAALGVAGGISSAKSSRKAAAQAMLHAKGMSDTAHYREAKDLERAGLNRILSATGGPGASSPQGIMPTTPDLGPTAIAGARLKAELDNIKAQTAFTKSKTDIATPFKDLGKTLGAVTTPLAESFAQIVNELPVHTAKAQNWLKQKWDEIQNYLKQKSHQGTFVHRKN